MESQGSWPRDTSSSVPVIQAGTRSSSSAVGRHQGTLSPDRGDWHQGQAHVKCADPCTALLPGRTRGSQRRGQ